MSIHEELNDAQKYAVRSLKDRRGENVSLVAFAVTTTPSLSRDEMDRLFLFLQDRDCFHDHDVTYGDQSFILNDRILDLIWQLDHPPPKDHWAERTQWFRSQWWSLPLIAVFIGLPALVQWGQMLGVLFGWLSGFIWASETAH